MSKIITSAIKRWPGTVTISDPLAFPQVFAWQDALEAARELGEDPGTFRLHAALLPGLIACVEEWSLDGFPKHPTPETFPATPPLAAARLIGWLIGEITELFQEAEDVPLAS